VSTKNRVGTTRTTGNSDWRDLTGTVIIVKMFEEQSDTILAENNV
jgi:hypothetical protein